MVVSMTMGEMIRKMPLNMMSATMTRTEKMKFVVRGECANHLRL